MIDWELCEEKFIRKAEADEYRIKSIVKRAKQRKKIIDNLKVDEETVSFVVEGYYEVIKEYLVAYMLANGFRSKNHQCLITYFYRKNPHLEGMAHLIGKMSYYRNRLNYYGDGIPLSFYEKHREYILKTIKTITNLLP
ncbi:MAG: hypothetical protein KKH52_03190 [Nanoarchaeota archaeon]|nr:hypothetical protein [Nanoarchaeota archaeon]MBU1974374.1 hypothetical protein [Nanoarchaeota archaeon]